MRIAGHAAQLELLVYGIHFVAFDDFAGLEFAVSGIDDLHEVDYAAAFYLAVRRLDESELVHARIAGKRADQSDVRAFRRLDGADAAVVRRMHVAHLKA